MLDDPLTQTSPMATTPELQSPDSLLPEASTMSNSVESVVPTDLQAKSEPSLLSSPSHPASCAPAKKEERELSEQELRHLFDDEEIERFLGLFADNLTTEMLWSEPVSGEEETMQSSEFIPGTSTEGWISINADQVPPPSRIPPTVPDAQSISEYIALKYVLPGLPPARPRPDRFTMGQLRLTTQRLYMVIQPNYGPAMSRMASLATWKNRRKSAVFCALYWTLWYYDLLMPALFYRTLHSLMRRKLLPYPTIAELHERRREAARSHELGEQIQKRLGSSSSSGLMEAWRLFRVFKKPNKAKVKQKQAKTDDKDKRKDKETKRSSNSSLNLTELLQTPANADEFTVLDDPHESQEESDFKKTLLDVLNDIADFHERVKNIFLWRRPTISKVYAAVLVFLIFFTAFLPAKYIMKLASFILGFLYWHVVPIIAALPPFDRSRLPPLFENVPTDAEYAMELISQRISRGEDIRPPSSKPPKARKSKKPTKDRKSKSTTDLTEDEMIAEADVASSGESTATVESDKGKSPTSRPGEVDWRKWGERAAHMKSWAAQGTRLVPDSEVRPSDPMEKTFLAHHKGSPGTLTLTRTRLFFTSITSTRSNTSILLDDVRGVKKFGISAVPGLSIKWHRSPDSGSYSEGSAEGSELVEEKFRWVGGRDEVFARLVGWGGRRWLKV
ncbi:hypothetical protein DFH11DRAFT_1558537 [Phellopilus nigrolimitatus]|nr:hypothetical protein DFH11DRAFT_1558537 [Phellopilus nigrolimitatus]